MKEHIEAYIKSGDNQAYAILVHYLDNLNKQDLNEFYNLLATQHEILSDTLKQIESNREEEIGSHPNLNELYSPKNIACYSASMVLGGVFPYFILESTRFALSVGALTGTTSAIVSVLCCSSCFFYRSKDWRASAEIYNESQDIVHLCKQKNIRINNLVKHIKLCGEVLKDEVINNNNNSDDSKLRKRAGFSATN